MSASPILVRTKTALITGEWWTIPWWQDEQYFKDGVVSRESAEMAFSELIKVFDAEWLLGQRINSGPPLLHPIATHLMAEGLLPFRFFFELGMNIKTARDYGLLGDIERRLKNRREYWEAAAFELKLLANLIRIGYKVERNYPSGKGRHNCDLKASNESETVFIEIKRPRELIAQNRKIINKAQSFFNSKLLTDSIKSDDDFTLSPLLSRAEADKVFSIVRNAVNKQIPDRGPGIIIVEAPHALDSREFAMIAVERFRGRKKYPSLSAVVLIKSNFHDSQIYHNSHIVFNPLANVDIKQSAITDFLHKLNEPNGIA